jgi:hypothetical protein
VDDHVVVTAEQQQVLEVGDAPVQPVDNMVGLQVPSPMTTRELAPSVPDTQGPPQSRRDLPRLAAKAKLSPRDGRPQDGDNPSVAGDPLGG